jgi:PilZ domain-containing protein
MTAIRAVLDARALGATRRTVARRKLRFAARGSADSGVTNVLILDISTTGLLLESDAALVNGETIELDLPEAPGIRALVKWTSGNLFGCQFKKPISKAAVSAALLRAPYAPSAPDLALSAVSGLAGQEDYGPGRQFLAAKLRRIAALALLSWAFITGAVWLAWSLFH